MTRYLFYTTISNFFYIHWSIFYLIIYVCMYLHIWLSHQLICIYRNEIEMSDLMGNGNMVFLPNEQEGFQFIYIYHYPNLYFFVNFFLSFYPCLTFYSTLYPNFYLFISIFIFLSPSQILNFPLLSFLLIYLFVFFASIFLNFDLYFHQCILSLFFSFFSFFYFLTFERYF